ncbi:MAG: heavy-metal-associated domain-containing protein [Bacteriovorax sp.]|jgi:copper chaperone|nr:heavy-metal-associated domain-containing protein [Bacteriovorax sp.]
MNFNKLVTLKVNGLHCNGCVNKIKKSLEELAVSQNTEVNISSGEVKVQFNAGDMNVSDIKAKIMAVGFQVESITLE